MMRVGFVGLGTMGAGMAANIRAQGFEITVHDLDPSTAVGLLDQGASWAESPRSTAQASDVVFTSLPTPSAVASVVLGEDGVLVGADPGTVIFDTSTNSREVVLRLSESCAHAGCSFLDAPVSGGPAGAVSGRLAMWVGGDEAVFEAHCGLLGAFADQLRYLGPVGHATVAKLVHNASGYMIQTALAEAFTMGVKAGVDPLTLWSALRQGSLGRVRTFDRLARQFLPGTYEPPSFALTLAHKDMSLATELGREVRVPMRLADAAHAEMTEALNRGWGARDSRVSMVLQQERAGVDIAVDPEALRQVLEDEA